jgi:hypothetical protein
MPRLCQKKGLAAASLPPKTSGYPTQVSETSSSSIRAAIRTYCRTGLSVFTQEKEAENGSVFLEGNAAGSPRAPESMGGVTGALAGDY